MTRICCISSLSLVPIYFPWCINPRMLPKVTTGLGILKMKQAFSVFAGNLDHPNEQWNSLCDWTDLAD